MHKYEVNGLVVASAFELFGVRRATSTRFLEPDIIVDQGRVPAEVHAPTRTMPNFSLGETEVVFRHSNVGSFWVRDGAQITVDRGPGVSDRLVSQYVTGSGLGLLYFQRGSIALHGSTVVTRDGTATMFIGPSGAGKSTLAHAFHRSGRTVLADDVSLLHIEPHEIIIKPSSTGLRLWDDALIGSEFPIESLTPIDPQFPKYLLPMMGDAPPPPARLKRIVHLAPFASGAPQLRALSGIEAAATLFQNTYRIAVIKALGGGAATFDRVGDALSRTSVLELRRPRELNRLDEIVELLEAP